MKARGQLQPIRVRWDEERDQYIIVCGEHRWRAAEMAGLPTMSCIIMEGVIEPSELLALQLIENMLREDLRPIEQARAFKTLMERNGWSTRQLADALAIVQPQVVRTLARPGPARADSGEGGAGGSGSSDSLRNLQAGRRCGARGTGRPSPGQGDDPG